jgi:hypothetical protein
MIRLTANKQAGVRTSTGQSRPQTAGDRTNPAESGSVQQSPTTSAQTAAVPQPADVAMIGPHSGQVNAAAAALLKLQADQLGIRTRGELAYFVANEPRQIMRAQQIIVLARGPRGDMRVQAVSSVTQVERSSPAILWFEGIAEALDDVHGLAVDCGFKSTAFGGGYQGFGKSYPLGHLLWVPWLDGEGQVFAGMLLARGTPFTSQDAAIGRHLAGSFSQTWRALGEPGWRKSRLLRASRSTVLGGVVAALLALAIPVPMNALAPVEIAPRAPTIVTAGVEGVILGVLVDPNQPIVPGQVLVRMVDTTLRNRFEIAEREVGVAAMRYKKAAQLAFTDMRGRHELAIAQAELELKTSERNYAADLLERTEIKADREGVAFFADKKDLVGKPVAVGEKLMEIANPSEIEFRIDLGVADAIVLREEARVKIFLDSDPMRSIEAKLVRAAYRARVRENQQLAFRLVAEAEPETVAALRLGARGTAQIYSDRVPLGFYLLRRPLAAARQWFGI